MEPPNGILTFTTGGKPHIEIEREFGKMLDRVRKEAVIEERRRRLLREREMDRGHSA